MFNNTIYFFKYECICFTKQIYIIFGKYEWMYNFLNKMSISEKRFIKPSFRENLVFILK